MVGGRHFDRAAGQAAHIHLERLDGLVELLARARPAAALERGLGELTERPAGDVHAGEWFRRAVLLLRGRNFGDRRIVVERRRVARHVVDVVAAASALRGLPDGVFGHAVGRNDIGPVVAGAAQRRDDAEVLPGTVMADDDVGLLCGDLLREWREVGGGDREQNLIPGATRLLHALLIVSDAGAATDAVEGHADNLAALLDFLDELADGVAGHLEHHAGAVGEWLRRRQRVADAAEGRHHRHADLAHLGVDRRLGCSTG